MHHTTPTPLTHMAPALKRYALSLTRDPIRADDLVQDTYMSMLTRSKSATPIETQASYMMSVMHNLFIDETRRQNSRGPQMPLEDFEPVAQTASQGLHLTCQETLEAITQLSPGYREVLSRHACQGQSYEEIGEALNIPIGTVMSRISRAREALCTALDLEEGHHLWDG